MKRPTLNQFCKGYVEAALWSSTDDAGNPMDRDHGAEDIAMETLVKMVSDCTRFQATNQIDLVRSGLSPDYQGHDFWLSRNGHGAGFWDRGLGAVGDKLHKAAKNMGEVYLYVGDDGKIYS